MGKGGSQKQQVNEYNMSMHFGIAAELDAITGIYVGEKQAWTGDLDIEGAINVDQPNLFGGPKKEGGVRGIAYYLPGGPNQRLPDGLAAKRGLTSTTSPAYRGLATCYFTGALPGVNPAANLGQAGFNWGATPYLQSVWITGRRAPKGLDPDYAMVVAKQVSFAVSKYGHDVTIEGVSATLSDGVATLVGTHSVTVTVSPPDTNGDRTQAASVDGVSVTFTSYYIDDDNDTEEGVTGVNILGTYGAISDGRFSANGITVSDSGSQFTVTMGGTGGSDANPAHIIYEALTNPTWGMGANDGIVDRDNFESVGQVLYHEGFGLSLQWTRESSIESFISEVLDHIQAAIYVDPDTGKLTLKLFRDDYDATTLPLITPDNAVLDNFQRKLWGETVNEIIATWTNPTNEQEETVTQQDLGNITIQGDVVSDSRNYYGARNSDLAARLATRDVRQSSAPLASVEALLDRTQWNLKPGSVVRLTWPEYGIANLVMRVTNIDYGKVGSPSITVNLLEDIFSLEDAAYQTPPATGFTSGAQPPTPMDHVRVITAPAYFAARYLSAADAAALTYPDTLDAILGANSNPDSSFYEIVGVTTLPNGQIVSETRGTRPLLGYGTLPSALVEEATSVVPTFGILTNGIGPNVAGFVFIGGGTELTQEIALIQSFDDAGWHISRGVLDTVPRAWPIGTPMWFYDIRSTFLDDEHHSAGEGVNYKLLTITSLGILDAAAAPVQGATLTGRSYFPNRPSNVVVGGVAFGPVDLSASAPSSVTISWSNRNRLLEDGAVLNWADATVMPESGQTTSIKLTKTTDGSVITAIDGLTGTTYSLPSSAFAGNFQADVTITAKRDGYESLMGVTRRVRIAPDPGGGSVGNPSQPSDPGYTPPTSYPDPQPPVQPSGGIRDPNVQLQ